VGLPGPIGEPCPRSRVPPTRAGEVLRRPPGRESPRDRGRAAARARWAGPHASIIKPGPRASTTSL